MHSYIFKFHSDGDTRWQRRFDLSSDETAKVEGGLMLENQAALNTLAGMAVTVLRLEGDELVALGAWTWREHQGEWSDGGGAIVGAGDVDPG